MLGVRNSPGPHQPSPPARPTTCDRGRCLHPRSTRTNHSHPWQPRQRPPERYTSFPAQRTPDATPSHGDPSCAHENSTIGKGDRPLRTKPPERIAAPAPRTDSSLMVCVSPSSRARSRLPRPHGEMREVWKDVQRLGRAKRTAFVTPDNVSGEFERVLEAVR